MTQLRRLFVLGRLVDENAGVVEPLLWVVLGLLLLVVSGLNFVMFLDRCLHRGLLV